LFQIGQEYTKLYKNKYASTPFMVILEKRTRNAVESERPEKIHDKNIAFHNTLGKAVKNEKFVLAY
jgi:hypothetical protein